jgi:hypothetical protein
VCSIPVVIGGAGEVELHNEGCFNAVSDIRLPSHPLLVAVCCCCKLDSSLHLGPPEVQAVFEVHAVKGRQHLQPMQPEHITPTPTSTVLLRCASWGGKEQGRGRRCQTLVLPV